MNEKQSNGVNNIAWIIFAVIFLFLAFECMLMFSDRTKIELLSAETEKIGDTYQGVKAQDGYEYYKVTSTLKNNGKEMLYAKNVHIAYKIKQELHGTDIYHSCEIFDESDNSTILAWDNSLMLPAWKTGKKVDIVQIPMDNQSPAEHYLNLELEMGEEVKFSQSISVKL